jgi:hypothetical protein
VSPSADIVSFADNIKKYGKGLDFVKDLLYYSYKATLHKADR